MNSVSSVRKVRRFHAKFESSRRFLAKLAGRRLQRRSAALTLLVLGGCLTTSFLRADDTWTGGGTTTNWSDAGNWNNGTPDTAPFGALLFSSSTHSPSNDDIASLSENYLGASVAFTINGTGAISLYDNSGSQSKIESTGTGTFTLNNATINFAATGGNAWGEINAVSGDVVFGTSNTLNVNGSKVAGIKLYGGGHNTTFNNTVNATGKYFSTTATNDTVNIGGTFTSGNFDLMNGGTLNLSGSGFTTSALRLGGDYGGDANAQNLSLGATFNLVDSAGGQTFGSTIAVASGNTSGALAINSQNTSGTNTLSGGFFLDSNLAVNTTAGGTLQLGAAASANTISFQSVAAGRILTLGGTGSTTVNEAFTGVSNGASHLVVTGGTVTLAADNSGSGANLLLDNIVGGTLAISSANNLGLPVVTGGGYPDKVLFGGTSGATTSTLLVNGTFSYGSTTANQLLGFAINESTAANTAIINVSGTNTFTLNGALSDFGSGTAGNFQKSGTGTLVLNDTANPYSGTTTIAAGTLTVAALGSLGTATSAINLGSATTTGTFNYNGGTAAFSRGFALAGNGVIASSASQLLTLGGTVTGTGLLTLSSNSSAGIKQGNTAIFSQTGGLTINNTSGAVTLTATNTYTGTTSVTAGTLFLGSTTTLPTTTPLVINGGTVDFNNISGGITVGSLSDGSVTTGTLTESGAAARALTVSGSATTTYGGLISGATGITTAGTTNLTLTNTNTNTLGATVSAGSTLTVTNTQGLGDYAYGTRSAGGVVTGSAIGTISGTSGTVLGTLQLLNNGTATPGNITFGGSTNGAYSFKLGGNGVIVVGNNGANAGNTIKLGTFDIQSTGTTTINAVAGSNYQLAVAAINSSDFTNNATFTGASGTITANTGLTVGSVSYEVPSSSSRTLTFGGSGAVSITGSVSEIKVSTGTLSLTENGMGSLTLGGSGSYTGGVTLSGGTLNINNATALGSGTFIINSSGVTIDNTSSGSITESSNPVITFGNSFNFTGSNSLNLGTGNASANGDRTVTLNGNNANSLTFGGTYINSSTGAHTLTVNNGTGVSGETLVLNNGVNLATGNSTTVAYVFAGTGNLTINGTIADGTGAAVGNGYTYNGGASSTGVLTLGGSNSYTGATKLAGGTVNLNNAGALSGSGVNLNGSALNNTSGGSITESNNVPISFTNSFAFGGSNSLNMGSGTVSNNGDRTITLNGNNSNTLTFGGVLQNTSTTAAFAIIVNNAAGVSGESVVFNNGWNIEASGGTGGVTGIINGAGNTVINGIIANGSATGNNSLSKTGTGTLTLGGNSSYTGTTSVSGGKLLVNGSTSSSSAVTASGTGTVLGGSGTLAGTVNVQSGSILSPGGTGGNSTAVLTTGALTLAGTYSIDLQGATPGTNYDQTKTTGAVTLTGSSLAFNSVNSSALTVGEKFYILLNGSGTAETSTFTGAAQGSTVSDGFGDTFQISYTDTGDSTAGNDISLTVLTAVPEPSTWLAGLLVLGTWGYSQRRGVRRWLGLVRRAA